MFRTSSGCSIRLKSGQNGRCTDVKFQSQNVQIFGNVYRSTNGPNHGPVMQNPVVFLERNLYGYGDGNLRKFFWKMK